MITFDVDMTQELCHNDVLNVIALLFMLSHNLIKVIVELIYIIARVCSYIYIDIFIHIYMNEYIRLKINPNSVRIRS
jgi:hypothetical protein